MDRKSVATREKEVPFELGGFGMENLNVILSLLGFLVFGSSLIHYNTSRRLKAQAALKAKKGEESSK